MKTLVDISKINDLNCGLGQFAYYLQEELLKIDKNIIFYADESSKDRVKGLFWAKKKWHRNNLIFRPNLDLWHGIHQDVDVYPTKKSIKKVLTIQDLNFIYENQKDYKKKTYLKNIQRKIDQSDAITFISDFTRSEVEKHLDISGKRTQIISNGICIQENKNLGISQRVKELVESLKSNKGYLFGIGTVVPKKNYKLAIEMAKSNENLFFIIAGTTFHSYAQEMKDEIKMYDLENRIHLLGEINEAEKLYLYQESRAFFHPSHLEGFGLPVIEAMHLGKPVICSNTTSLPEVTGGLAFLFDPTNAESALESYRQFDRDNESEKVDGERLKRHASQFSWEAAAKQFYNLYTSI